MEFQSFCCRVRPLSAVDCRLSSAWPLSSLVSRLPSSSRSLSAVFCLLSSLACAAVQPFATGITTDRPAGVFIEGVGAAFRPEGKARFSRWTVTDFFDETVASGAWPTNGISLVLPALGPGYYELDADGPDGARGHFAFTVVQDPATRRPPAPDSPYAMMAGGSAWPKGDPEKTNADLMRLAGQASVRKIYRWEHIEKAPGKFELVPHRNFTQTYADAGIKVCGMIHRPPKWADTAVVVPRNLRQMYAFCRRLERELGGAMCAWEIYNEQDLPQSVGDGCWNYTAAQKASYLGFKSKNAARIVFSGALCLDVGLGYDSLWLDNDGAYYSDGLNYHTYFPLGANDKWFGEWRDLLAKYGITNWATWVTEDCTNQEGDALVERPGTPNRAHTKDQERLLAEFYAKDQVFKQMNGVSRSYFFILAAYNEREGRKDWGIYRRDGTLKPCYAAAAALTGELEGATLLGEVTMPDARLRGFLYAQPDGRRTLVYWTVTDFERQVERDRAFQDAPLQDVAFALPLPKGDYRAVRLTGDRRTVSVTGTSAALVATRYPAYLTGRFDLPVVRRAVPMGRLVAPRPPAGTDLTLIVRADGERDATRIGSSGRRLDLLTETPNLTIQVWNLSRDRKRGRLVWDGAKLEGVPEAFDLPPAGCAEFTVRLSLLDLKSGQGRLNLRCVADSGKSTACVIPLFSEWAFAHARTLEPFLRANDPKEWYVNGNASKMSVTWDDREQAICLAADWTGDKVDGKWFFPGIKMNGPEGPVSSVCGLVFETKSEQDKVENDWKTSLVQVMGGKIGGYANWLQVPPPSSVWESRQVNLVHDPDIREGATSLQYGGMPGAGNKVRIWIRNIRLVR